jgi:hypothetical protein
MASDADVERMTKLAMVAALSTGIALSVRFAIDHLAGSRKLVTSSLPSQTSPIVTPACDPSSADEKDTKRDLTPRQVDSVDLFC